VPHLQLEGSEATAAAQARTRQPAGAAGSGGGPRESGGRTYTAVSDTARRDRGTGGRGSGNSSG
jgi:hypothetical protein